MNYVPSQAFLENTPYEILAIKHLERQKRSGRCRFYSSEAITHLQKLWIIMGQMCSKKMIVALPTWLEFYKEAECDIQVKEELLAMSSATIDRYLRKYKTCHARRKRSGTKPGKMLKNVIPIKEFDRKIERPGYVEADTVAHCGDSMSGKFIWSLTFTDVYSGWTDNRAIWTKDSDGVLSAICDIQFKLPYQLLAFHSDNGGEFLNRNLIHHFSCDDKQKEVMFTRSRAYKKNDNCHVEQKNWTHGIIMIQFDYRSSRCLVHKQKTGWIAIGIER